MIVKCEQCQTKFKIPDEKVTEKGVKVRCTKCQHTFRVKRTDSAPAPAPHLDATTEKRVVLTKGEEVRPEILSKPTRLAPAFTSSAAEGRPSAPPPAAAGLAFDPSNPFGNIDREATARAPSSPPPSNAAVLPAQPRVPPRAKQEADFNPQLAADPFGWDLPGTEAQPASVPASPAPVPFAVPATSRPAAAARPAPASPTEDDPFALDAGSRPAPARSGLGQSSVSKAQLFGEDLEDATEAVSPAAAPEPDRGMFDIPPPPNTSSGMRAVELGSEPLGDSGIATAPLPRPSIVAPVPSPLLQVEEESGIGDAPRSGARRAAAILVNVGLAAVLVVGLVAIGNVYANDGKLDLSALSFSRLASTMKRADWVVQDVSNGLYETKSGRPIFYVRGEVTNRGSTASLARVGVQIMDGIQIVQSAQTLAGATPTPEALFKLQSVQDASSLAQRLGKEAAAIAPGARAPFLLTFYDYPADLAGLRLKVSIEPVPSRSTAAR